MAYQRSPAQRGPSRAASEWTCEQCSSSLLRLRFSAMRSLASRRADPPCPPPKKEGTERSESRGGTEMALMEQAEIQALLPHRYPFLLVDRVLELDPDRRIVGIKNVTVNEPFFQGHFPGRPVMPGVLILEAMSQVGAILALKSLGHATRPVVYLT